MVSHLPLGLMHPQWVWEPGCGVWGVVVSARGKHHMHAPLGFYQIRPAPKREALPRQPQVSGGGRGREGFCAWKNVLWCSSGACGGFCFSVAFLISAGKSNGHTSLHRQWGERVLVRQSRGRALAPPPQRFAQGRWLHRAPGSAPAITRGDQCAPPPCL